MTVRPVLFLPLVLSVCGCSHLVLYDENRDKQAHDAQKAVTEAHVSNAIAEMEKTFAEVAQREEASAREYETYLFDLELATVARAPSLSSGFGESIGVDGLATVTRARLHELGLRTPGSDLMSDSEIDQVWRTDTVLVRARQALDATFLEVHGTIGHKFSDCAEVFAESMDPSNPTDQPSEHFLNSLASDAQRSVALDKFAGVFENCKAVESAIANHVGLYSSGLISQLAAHVKELRSDITKYAVAESEARKTLDTQLEAFKAASPPPGKSSLAELQTQAKRLHDKLEELIKAGGPALQHVIAEEKLRRLEALLSAVAATPGEGTVALGDDEKVAVAIVQFLPSLKDEADKLFAEASKPRLVPFLIAIDQQKLVVQGFEARKKAKLKQLDAAQNRLDAAYREALAAARVMQPIIKNPSWANQSLKELNKLDSDKKVALYRALGTYADDVRSARIEGAVWQVRERAAQFEASLIQSKFAAAQWDSLMDMMVKVLSDYHASGIKQADIAEFFKALGLVSIGIGVAQ